MSLRAAVAFAFVAFLPIAAPAQQQPPQPGTAVVSGQVLDATTGKPVPAVTVTLAMGAPPAVVNASLSMPQARTRIASALTNTQGRFVFREVPAGDFSLTATAEGYAAGASGRKRIDGPGSTFTVKDGARIADANIRVWRHAAISGIVRDDRGEPVVGVPVWALRRSFIGGQLSLSLEGGRGESTDDRGMYRISGLLPGSFVIAIRLSTQSVPVALSDAYRAAVASGTTGSITRTWGGTGALGIEGGGIWIDDFQVRVPSGQPPVLPGPNNTLLVHPSLFHPTASMPSDATAIDLAAADDRTGVDLRLPLVAGVRVSGVLTGPDGPLANSGLRLIPAPSSEIAFDIPVAYSTTDANGRFALLGVPAGSYIIRAFQTAPPSASGRPAPPGAGAPPINTFSAEGGGAPLPAIFAELPVIVGTSNVDGLSVVMQPGARLIGRLGFDGNPPAAAQIQRIQLNVRPVIGTQPTVTVQIDGEGHLTSSGIAPGRYTLTTGAMPAANTPGTLWALASARVGRVDAAQEAFTIGADDITDVVVALTEKSIALAGTVRNADGAASSDATVVVFPADTQAWMASGMSIQRVVIGSTNAAGTFDLRVPFAGEYLVVAIPPEVNPEVDPAFVKRFAGSGVRVSLALGDMKTQPLTMARAK